MAAPKIVLVTGASSGIGRSTARLLAQRGFTTFGTSRAVDAAGQLPGVDLLPLDVRSDASVQSCVDRVLERAGRIDVIVNNAGYVLTGAVEKATIEQAQAQFETNVFGPMRTIKAVLPIFRRQGGGTKDREHGLDRSHRAEDVRLELSLGLLD